MNDECGRRLCDCCHNPLNGCCSCITEVGYAVCEDCIIKILLRAIAD